MQLAPEAGPALPRRPSRLLGLPGSPAAVLPPSPPDFQLLMLQTKHWSIELRKRLKPDFSSIS